MPLLTVVTVTLVPVARALMMEVLSTVPVVLVPAPAHALLVLVTLVLATALIVISVGSINHSLFFPLLAPLTLPSMVSIWPEVSTKPPSPALLPITIVELLPI